jgi:Peptidase A4 family
LLRLGRLTVPICIVAIGIACLGLGCSPGLASTPIFVAGPEAPTPGDIMLPPTPGGAQTATTGNWSGYVAVHGPYTAVTGAFNVPSIVRYVAGSTLSEWVGIGGYTNRSLIQAGVNEIPEGPGQVLVEPWWEALPAPQRIASGIMARVDDTVRVTLQRTTAGWWAVNIADETDGDTFTTDLHYDVPLLSAEWVVEANAQLTGSTTALAPYKPEVTFTGLGVIGPRLPPARIVMVQHGYAVSTPSLLGDGGFNVAYGDTAPPAP